MQLATFTAVLPALATITTGAMRTERIAKKLRAFRPESVVGGPLVEAIIAILAAGHVVKVSERDMVFTPTLEDGVIVWNARRTAKHRKTSIIDIVF